MRNMPYIKNMSEKTKQIVSTLCRGPLGVVLSVTVSVFLVVGLVEAATTVSNNIDTEGTLNVDGATTLNGNTTLGNAATDVNLFTGTLQASTTALFTGATTFYGNLTIDKAATTTVTFSDEGINFDSNTFVIDPNANRVGLVTATPNTTLEVVGTASSTSAVVGGGTTVTGIVFGTCTYNPGVAITATTTLSTSCTGADGVRTGDKVFVTPRSLETELVMTSASSTAANVIQVSVFNMALTQGDVTPASATWDWMAIR